VGEPIAIGGIIAPDSELTRMAAALAEQALSPTLLNHVHRTWWFAEFIGRKRQMKYDRELVYLASLLHDLGLSPAHAANNQFEVDGADAAHAFLGAQGYPAGKSKIVWDAIALHTLAGIAERREPEVALVHFGAYVEVTGLGLDEISPKLIDDTIALYPRLGFKKAFTEALAEVARKKPQTVIGTGVADIGRRLVPGLEIPNVCDLILGAPFDS